MGKFSVAFHNAFELNPIETLTQEKPLGPKSVFAKILFKRLC